MGKRRFGLSAKVGLLTGGLTIITLATSLTVSSLFSYSHKKADFMESCSISTDVIEQTFSGTSESGDDVTNLKDIIGLITTSYNEICDNYDQLSDEEITKYQQQLSIELFGPLDGSIGMSYERVMRKNFYVTAIYNMQSVCSTYEVPSSSISLYDKVHNRSIAIACSNIGLENNYYEIGLAKTITDKETLFFESGLPNKTFDSNQLVYAYNILELDNINSGYVCFIRAEYSLEAFNSSFTTQLTSELAITAASAVLLVVIYLLFLRIFLIKNFKKLSKTTEQFVGKMKNDEELKIIECDINSNDEIKDLSDEFLTMQEQIIAYVDNIKTAKNKEQQLQTEISIASKIQLESLPGYVYYDRNTELRALIQPAKGVGGDFYDYFYIDKDHLALVIADVSGKGIPASLFMMRAKESIKSATANEKKLSDVLFKVNNALVTNNKEGFFVTAFVGVLNLSTYNLDYVNAGHERPYIKRNGKVEQLSIKSNFVLGLEEDFVYEQESVQLKKGDVMFLHTDGLNEAINTNKEEYGYQRIGDVLSKENELKESISDVIKDLEAFRGEEEQFDDITILAIKIREEILNVEIDNPNYDSITDATMKVEEYLEGVNFEIVSKIGIIIDEAMNNIISYGKAKTNKKIVIQVEKHDDDIELIFIDNSHPFNPLNKKMVTVQENLEAGIVGGLGISIIKSISKEAEYAYTNNKNILRIKM